MIKLYDSDITDILPSPIAKKASVIALGYAIKMAIRRLLKYCQNISIYSGIDTVPEEVLDMLAAELNTQYYEDTLDIETKRKLVKNTLKWYMTAGTYGCVEDVILTIFGKGSVTPWYEDETGEMEPGYFDVEIDSRLGDETYEKFLQIIEYAKNASSHLRQITSVGNTDTNLIAKLGKVQEAEMILTNDIEINDEDRQAYIAGYMAIFDTAELIDTSCYQDEDKSLVTDETLYEAMGITQSPEMILMEIRRWDTNLDTGMEEATGIVQSLEMALMEVRSWRANLNMQATAGTGLTQSIGGELI